MTLRRAAPACLAGFLLAVGPSVWGETPARSEVGPPLVARMELMQLSDTAMAKIQDGSRLAGGLPEQSGVRVLQSSDLLMVPGEESQVHFGQKFPLVYFDPRSSQFQVNYVDTGIKFDIHCRKTSANAFQVKVRHEVSEVELLKPATNPAGGTYPQTILFSGDSKLDQVEYHQSVAVLRVQGQSAQSYLSRLGIQSGGDNLVVLITLTPAE